ncbi:Peptidoglycan O-acetyltransferase [Bdellovibrio bacteriovorus]|uniref:MBOAT family O-acyltransferase n=1 Tax=Bdellovibrio bacteriovorus TaxID=959 RepID=UPI00045BF820|nr:MBOAT family O-acyltransferase [Bdellovibrio bacteriovorus]AHZ84207.1 alginate O-acetyltransferase [Bdellovibrio bacteriovorus]BEV68091.1 Peptidoglycan O-acetyltransferase [Bdellovibrio bacteriovorus]
MLFNSYAFLFLFLPFTLLGYYWITKKNLQLWFLFLSSVFFYCYWSTVYVFLLLFTVVLDFYLAKAISMTTSQARRKMFLLISVIANLGILGFFKYYNFFADSLNGALQVTGLAPPLPILNLVLPIGISFYTFQSLSYVIDVYRRTSNAHAHLLEFAGYVTLFPHQISGPLVRHNYIVPQLEDSKTYFFNPENFWKGCYFFVFGLAKKMMIADRIAAVVDPLVMNMAGASTAEAWIAMIGYTMQLYFDFSGYSDMAVGLGLMMNIQFPQNFNSPYKSLSITEFWQRWHITLSSWLKDYLYISLGGNRAGVLKTYRNLFLTMAIGGLWHGANWTYLVWGCFHGGILAIERLFKDRGWKGVGNKYVKWTFTFFLVCVGWVFFRAHSVDQALFWLQKVFMLNGDINWDITLIPLKHKDRFFAALGVGILVAFLAKNTWEREFKPTLWRAALMALMFVVCLMYMGEESPFLYFQF